MKEDIKVCVIAGSLCLAVFGAAFYTDRPDIHSPNREATGFYEYVPHMMKSCPALTPYVARIMQDRRITEREAHDLENQIWDLSNDDTDANRDRVEAALGRDVKPKAVCNYLVPSKGRWR